MTLLARRRAILGSIPTGAPPAFDPRTQVTALHVMWADDPDWTDPGDGNAVTTWRNHSGGGDPAEAGGNRPTFDAVNAAYNNRATIHFTRTSSQRLKVNLADIAQPLKLLVVGNTGSAGTAERFLGFGGLATHVLGDTAGNLWTLRAGSTLDGTASDLNPHVVRATLNGASSGMWVDEASVLSGDAGANGIAWLSIGCDQVGGSGGTNHLNGDVAFVGIYAGATSDAALSTLADDLATYYGTP